ncbi:MAG TPA: aldo/keto reductase [Gaiellaceae bacterium]|jgi:aryl-alcohol dehydrogenase-like predicted oxidoreductase
MRTRSLGNNGPEVSLVGLGTNNFGPRIDYDRSLAVIDAALDAGITLLDTADIYGQGKSEEIIGRALEGRREGVLIATKFGKPMDERPEERRGSPAYIHAACEASLRRLRTDVIDVYQMHEPDEGTPIEETLGALDDLITAGKVRYIGSSNYSAEQIEEADRAAGERKLTRFVSAQNHYSLVERDIEDDMLPTCERLGIGMLPYFPLASGLLTGKYTRGETATEGRLAGREIPDARWDRLARLNDFATERRIPLLSLAIGGLAAMPAVASVIAGATTPEQVRANVTAGAWEPTGADLDALQALRV